MFRQGLRIIALLAGLLATLSVAGAVSTRPHRGLIQPAAARAEPAATFVVYQPIVRRSPPLPTKIISGADDDVIQGFPNSNYANADLMWLGYHKVGCTGDTSSGKASRDLIRFDVSAIPAGTSIADVKLNVRVVGECWYKRTSATVTAYRVSQSWSETAATWNTQPATAEAYGSVAIPLNYGAGGWYSLDVTSLARGWVNGSTPNYGLMLRAPESGGDDFAFIEIASRSWSGYEPYLQITYTGPAALEQAAPASSGPGALTCRVNETGISVCTESSSSEAQRHDGAGRDE